MGIRGTQRSQPRLVPNSRPVVIQKFMSQGNTAADPATLRFRKHLIVTGDDFGLNSRVNEAIEHLHQARLLTQASLMVNESGLEEALRIARRNPALCVGLHLTLCGGHATRESPLTVARRRLCASPMRAGFRYVLNPRLRGALAAEIASQFEKFASFGLPPVYWDGHMHLHLHPTVLRLSVRIAAARGFCATRLVREPGWGMLPWVFRRLSQAAKHQLARSGIAFVDRVYGLRRSGQITTRRFEDYLLAIPSGWTEIYLHPGAEPADLDVQLLLELLEMEGIRLGNARALCAARAVTR